jgi:hypothetical protein
MYGLSKGYGDAFSAYAPQLSQWSSLGRGEQLQLRSQVLGEEARKNNGTTTMITTMGGAVFAGLLAQVNDKLGMPAKNKKFYYGEGIVAGFLLGYLAIPFGIKMSLASSFDEIYPLKEA